MTSLIQSTTAWLVHPDTGAIKAEYLDKVDRAKLEVFVRSGLYTARDNGRILAIFMPGDWVPPDLGVRPQVVSSSFWTVAKCAPGCTNAVAALQERQRKDMYAWRMALTECYARGNTHRLVARWLLWYSQQLQDLSIEERWFSLPFTRKEIAGYLGLSMESVSRALSSFNKRGLVAVNLREIQILDAAALSQID